VSGNQPKVVAKANILFGEKGWGLSLELAKDKH